MAVTSPVSVTFSSTVVTSLSGVMLRAAPLPAPVLTNLQLTASSEGVSATIDTDQATGTIYYSVQANATPIDLVANGSSVAAASTTTLDAFATGLTSATNYVLHVQQVNGEGTSSTYTTQAFVTADPAVQSTTPVSVLFGAADETILPIASADTSSQSLFGFGSGAVDDGDKLLWKTISGDSSNLTINADGTWSFSVAPTEDVVIGVRVWDSSAEIMGAAGQITFDATGITHVIADVTLRPTALALASSPVQIQQGQSVSFTFDDVAVTPTYANTRIFLGGASGLEITSFSNVNNYGDRYTFTFSVPTDATELYGSKDVLFVIEGQTTTVSNIPYIPVANWDYVGVVNPEVTESWSAFKDHTGDAPVTGGQLVWTITSIEAGLVAEFEPTGSLTVDQADAADTSDVVITQNITADVYYLSPAGEKGDTATKTFLADAIPPTVTLIGDAVINLTQGQSYTDEGANVTDNIDPSTTIYADTVPDISQPGVYTYHYTYTDTAGNTTQATRTINVIDTVPPVLTLIGASTVTHVRGDAYADLGANATDAFDGPVTPLVTANMVNISQNGSYSYTYTATDAAGNSASITRTVNVVDPVAQLAPTLAYGSTSMTLDVGDTYTNPAWTAYDDLGPIDVDWNTTTVNTGVVGTYYRTASAVNAVGTTSQTLTINVIEPVATVVPTITPTTSTALSITIGDAYNDPAWTAADDLGPVAVAWTGTAVDTASAGVYVRRAMASNSVGAATPIDYQVTVLEQQDTLPPEISLLGSNPVEVTVGTVYNDAGATAFDLADGNISDRILTTNNVNSFAAGTYSVIYQCTDDAGNTATRTRTVNVVEVADLEPPVIVLIGSTEVYVDVGGSYLELGAVASDTVDGDLSNNIAVTNNVDTNSEGVYVVRYNVSDSAGNAAVEVTRTVVVNNPQDDTIPVIALLGGATIELPLGAQFIEPGYIATDNLDGNISDKVLTSTDLNMNQVGTYTVTYTVRDSSNNQAIPVERTILVYDDTKPEIRLIGASVLYVDLNGTFADSGATVRSGVDGAQTVYSANSVDPATAGTYSLSYNYVDSEGEAADTIYRTVIVRDPSNVVVDYRDTSKSIIKPIIKRIIN